MLIRYHAYDEEIITQLFTFDSKKLENSPILMKFTFYMSPIPIMDLNRWKNEEIHGLYFTLKCLNYVKLKSQDDEYLSAIVTGKEFSESNIFYKILYYWNESWFSSIAFLDDAMAKLRKKFSDKHIYYISLPSGLNKLNDNIANLE